MVDKTDATIVDEVEKRLDDLFGDEDDGSGFDPEKTGGRAEAAPVLEEYSGDVEETPLKDLKSTVLSIEWEITDDIMGKFLDQVEKLKKEYPDDKIIQMFLQLLGSVGRYIKVKKASADPDVVKLLNSAYAGLEKVLLTEEISETERKKLLVVEVNKFKKLRARLTGKSTEKKKTGPTAPAEESAQEAAAEPTSATEEAAVIVPSRRKGPGIGSRMSLIVFLPLVVIALASFIYIGRLTTIPAQIEQFLQTVSGLSLEGVRAIIYGVLCGLIILVGLIAMLYGNRLAERIKILTDVVDRIGNGETSAPVEIGGNDEIGVLADAVKRMRDSLC